MQFMSVVFSVKDMAAARRFYTGLIGLEVAMDLGANLSFKAPLALQTQETFAGFVNAAPQDVHVGNASEVYFETEDLDAFTARLADWPEVRKVHDVREYPWGQRVLRLFDPDGHIVEIGETMETVTMRFLLAGLSDEDVQARVMYPMEFVLAMRKRLEADGKL